ncbi:MAG: tRNA (adenosine(37)-N6)-threonylcarbamoyltransferase complex ATPase subunit type 1 TsaE [Deltaproteobacteria bacterium]|nr:tRNA (adenosine(37)-N6)-threonylcarbamoyltransferase complex ATPase subunit type 1 TsaE [Deltaproteobacteria bacterium]
MNCLIESESIEKTRLIGEFVGDKIAAGSIICLYGELGSGKTAFVQGVGKGLLIPKKYYITSPTYNLINEYPGKTNLFHIDLYRIEDKNDLENIGFYEVLEQNGITAIEWAERLGEKFFSDYLEVKFKIISDNLRIISFTGHGKNGINCSEIRRRFGR